MDPKLNKKFYNKMKWPAMATIKLSCCGAGASAGSLGTASLALAGHDAEKDINQHCGKISRAGHRRFLGVLWGDAIHNGVSSNTGSPSCPGPFFRRKLLKLRVTSGHFQSFGLAVPAAIPIPPRTRGLLMEMGSTLRLLYVLASNESLSKVHYKPVEKRLLLQQNVL